MISSKLLIIFMSLDDSNRKQGGDAVEDSTSSSETSSTGKDLFSGVRRLGVDRFGDIDVIERAFPGQRFFCKGMPGPDKRATVNPILLLDPKDFANVDCRDFRLSGTMIPVDKTGNEGYVVSVSETTRTAVVSVLRKVSGEFPRLSDVEFVEVDLDQFGSTPWSN